VGHGKIAVQILEHRRLSRIDAGAGDELVVGRLARFRQQVGSDNVEDIVEMVRDAEPFGNLDRMGVRPVGENVLAPRQGFNGAAEIRIGIDPGMVDIVDIFKKVVGIDVVLDHQAAQGRAVLPVVGFLDRAGIVVGDIQDPRHIFADLAVNLRKQVRVPRIKRVVEVEHPGLDILERVETWLRGHGDPFMM